MIIKKSICYNSLLNNGINELNLPKSQCITIQVPHGTDKMESSQDVDNGNPYKPPLGQGSNKNQLK